MSERERENKKIKYCTSTVLPFNPMQMMVPRFVSVSLSAGWRVPRRASCLLRRFFLPSVHDTSLYNNKSIVYFLFIFFVYFICYIRVYVVCVRTRLSRF